MISAKADWVYQLPCTNWPGNARQVALFEGALHAVFGANQVQKKIRAAHAKEKQRIQENRAATRIALTC
jgi:hypothetical protein